MWCIHLHHIQIRNISNILKLDAKNSIYWKIATLICLRYMILILIVFSHESAALFGYNYLCQFITSSSDRNIFLLLGARSNIHMNNDVYYVLDLC
jgi:hypothetical protein